MKQEIKKELKRQAILNSAAACFENRRFDEVTLDEIALASRLSGLLTNQLGCGA